MNLKPLALGAAMALSALSMPAMADDDHKHPRFTLSSPDLASGDVRQPLRAQWLWLRGRQRVA